MLWAFAFVILAIVIAALLMALHRAGHTIEQLRETEPLICAHCGEDPDPDGEWFAENIAPRLRP